MNRELPELVNYLELTIHPASTESILRAILWSIFFQRTLDNCEPETFEVLDTHVACCPSREVEKEVEGRIAEFIKTYLETGKDSGELAVVFLQRKSKKGWFAQIEELVPWEEHLIRLNFSRTIRRDSATALNKALMQTITFCSTRKMNVPPLIGSGEQSNLSHQILISPPSPSEIFAPSPPLNPTRLTSPPPVASTTTTAATATARDMAMPHHGHGQERDRDREYKSRDRDSSPAAMGYLEQAKEGFRAVRAGAGAVAGWRGRGVGQ